ncbi:MAG: alkane 1-monooxygenase 1 [Chitinophagales bacterium]|nr:MAG: alkane 1-monooxygenase 1 [Chitinophagales bacterium]
MDLKPLRYTFVLSGLFFGIISLTGRGIWTYALPVYAFVIIPVLELLLPATGRNLTEEEEKKALNNPWYDYVLYAMVPLLYGFLLFGVFSLCEPGLSAGEIAGRVFSLGVAMVSIGINIGHELGHRQKALERFLAKMLLLPSLQLHFIIEHNRGHHKRVATGEDPATARYGEWLYSFWFRSWIGGYISAWKLEAERLRRKGLPAFSLRNEMIWFELIQAAWVIGLGLVAGWMIALYFVFAALIAKLLLETINYIEHYGLSRKKTQHGYERVLPVHSWNSNHWIGRVMLFELTRHSDHHYKASRKYQVLRHYEDVPQMPAGYPAMIVLALIPPLWMYIMHRQIRKVQAMHPAAVAA